MVRLAWWRRVVLAPCVVCASVSTASAEPPEVRPAHVPTAGALGRYVSAVQHPRSGLLFSFPRTTEPALRQVAFTYDMAAGALVLSHRGDWSQAARVLAPFQAMPLPRASRPTFNTAYHVAESRPTLEHQLHGGPLYWMAIALMRYGRAAHQPQHAGKGVALLEWAKDHLRHVRGGVVMGTAAPWEYLMSTENNWVYYAALRLAAQSLPDGARRRTLAAERAGVRAWLEDHLRDRGEGDATKALDVYTHALLVGPDAHLEDGDLDPQGLAAWAAEWIEELEARFRVPGTARYDYTDAAEARRIGRARAGWLEGTEQVTVAYQTWAPFFERQGDIAFARRLRESAAVSHADVLRFGIAHGPSLAIPNTDATRPFRTFMDGWTARPRWEPALNGTTWAYFADVGYNPLASR